MGYIRSRVVQKKNVNAEARQFPLRAGFPEDAATGVRQRRWALTSPIMISKGAPVTMNSELLRAMQCTRQA